MDNKTKALLQRFARSEESQSDLNELKKRISNFISEVSNTNFPKGRHKEKYGNLAASFILEMGSNPGTRKIPERVEQCVAEVISKLMDDELLPYGEAARIASETFDINIRTAKEHYSKHSFNFRTREWLNYCGHVNFAKAGRFVNWLSSEATPPFEINQSFSVNDIASGSVVLMNEIRGPHDCGSYPIQKIHVEKIKWNQFTPSKLTPDFINNVLWKKAKGPEIDEAVWELHYLTSLILKESEVIAEDVKRNKQIIYVPPPETAADIAVLISVLKKIEFLVNTSR